MTQPGSSRRLAGSISGGWAGGGAARVRRELSIVMLSPIVRSSVLRFRRLVQRLPDAVAGFGEFGRSAQCAEVAAVARQVDVDDLLHPAARSEEHTSELQSLMRISYAVFCLKKKKTYIHHT